MVSSALLPVTCSCSSCYEKECLLLFFKFSGSATWQRQADGCQRLPLPSRGSHASHVCMS